MNKAAVKKSKLLWIKNRQFIIGFWFFTILLSVANLLWSSRVIPLYYWLDFEIDRTLRIFLALLFLANIFAVGFIFCIYSKITINTLYSVMFFVCFISSLSFFPQVLINSETNKTQLLFIYFKFDTALFFVLHGAVWLLMLVFLKPKYIINLRVKIKNKKITKN
ncbi:hypothetical protein MSGX11T_01895 [Mycoplasma synoviae GX11-T]|nr:hypothetical protein [Mycoplasmopsis synoviae]MBD5788758.1 hypothetical protein [Mycoplasmopsis synoviae GX11-T]